MKLKAYKREKGGERERNGFHINIYTKENLCNGFAVI